MQTLKTTFKTLMFAIALAAMVISLAPLSAQPAEEHQDPPPDGSGGGSLWTVTCVWDGNGVLQSRTCTSGGGQSCAC